jgi:DNA-binding transcriptional LysR family regulator
VKISELRTFVAVAETGSVQHAANRLHMTQPAATRQIQRIEEELGATLLDRRCKPLALTSAGRTVLKHCSAILREIEALKVGLSPDGEPQGEFRLGVGHGVGELALSEPIDALRRRFPRLNLSVSSNWSHALIRAVEQAEIEAALILLPDGQQPPVRVSGCVIGREDLLVVAPLDWPIAKRTSFRELAEFPWVLNPDGCSYRALLHTAFAKQAISPAVAIETFGSDLQLSLVARRAGLGLITARKLARSSYSDAVKVAHVRDRNFSVATWAIRADEVGLTSTVVDALEKAIRAIWD